MLAVCPEEDALLCLLDDPDDNLQAHVDACTMCRRRLEQMGREIENLRQMTRVALTPPTTERLPIFANYIVIGRLGSGGQADVYRALDSTLGLEVAIKWSRQELTGPAKEHPLAREGQDLCQLNHPHLVRVFGLGVQDNRPYLVMDYVRGCNLEQLVRDKVLPTKQAAVRAARLLLPIAQALAEVHRHDLVHLDLKPHNILIDRAGKPYLTDFGLARHYDAKGVAADRPLGGTPGFMAPEQAGGQAHRMGPQTDIFGLGAVLYRLLAGQPLFADDEPMRVVAETAAGKLDLSPLRSSGAPRPLTAICQRALAVEPDERYANAGALAKDLHRFLRRGVLQAVVAGTGVAVLAVAGAGYALRPTPPPPAFPEGPHYLIHCVRREEKQPIKLETAVPLRCGDKVELRCPVPKGYRVALFWFDAAGTLKELGEVRTLPSDDFDEVVLPAEEKKAYQLSGPPGTNLLLLCAGPGRPPSRAELERLLVPDGPLPRLPDWFEKELVCLDRNQVKEYPEVIRGVDLVPIEKDPLSIVKGRLHELRLQLRDRWPFLAGVAMQQGE